VDRFFGWLEGTALSTWLSESPSLLGLPLMLVLHTVGLAFLVGASVAIDARILGIARAVPLLYLRPYYRVMWAGLGKRAFRCPAVDRFSHEGADQPGVLPETRRHRRCSVDRRCDTAPHDEGDCGGGCTSDAYVEDPRCRFAGLLAGEHYCGAASGLHVHAVDSRFVLPMSTFYRPCVAGARRQWNSSKCDFSKATMQYASGPEVTS
jgi:hypothetical protein